MPWPARQTYQERKESRRRAEEAAAAIAARGPVEPPADELARATWLLDTAQYQFARSMPKNPHWYTLRRKWENDADFVFVVAFIRQYGYVERFPDREKGWPYIMMDIGEHKYWTMGAPIGDKDTPGSDHTILINRKPLCSTESAPTSSDTAI